MGAHDTSLVNFDGVLPDFAIVSMIDAGAIRATALGDGQVQPSSIDLRLGTRGHRLRASFLPGRNRVEDILQHLAMTSFDLGDGAVLERDSVYLIEIQESLALPAGISAKANPKSSTGRLDVFVRIVAEQSTAFDQVPAGYHGRLWLEIVPKTFPIVVRPGSRLSQMRFARGSSAMTDADLARMHAAQPVVSGDPVMRNGLCLGLDLTPAANGIVGWRARRYAGVIDVDKVATYAREQFWAPVYHERTGLILEPGEFYILASKQGVAIPANVAAEMVPFDAGVGEFRAHYAGFFDPGFGWAKAVLEVRPHDVPFFVEDGQVVAKLRFEAMVEPPSRIYGAGIASNYQGQGLRLSKHFIQS